MCKNSCRVCACCKHLILYIESDEWHVVPQNTPAKDIFVWIQRGSDALVLAARSKIFGEWWSATICLYVSLVQTERSERSQTSIPNCGPIQFGHTDTPEHCLWHRHHVSADQKQHGYTTSEGTERNRRVEDFVSFSWATTDRRQKFWKYIGAEPMHKKGHSMM